MTAEQYEELPDDEKFQVNASDAIINVPPAKVTTHQQQQQVLSPGKHTVHSIQPGMKLEWQDIKLSIKVSRKPFQRCCSGSSGDGDGNDAQQRRSEIPILKGISGCANPGELYGIIGASGGGKTTLLSILSGRIGSISSLSSNSVRSGFVTLNNISVNCGVAEEFNYLTKNVAFVMQNDLLYATERCREAITVSALLRLPDYMSTAEKMARVAKTIASLDLDKCSETYIGSDSIRGLSGGEKTRVSIGTELVTNPNLIILDEPTSGLDSASAYSTMVLLKKLAESGKTVITCIHQPSTEIFDTIDRILILAKGYVVYEGAIKNGLYDYLQSIDCACPNYSNVADFVIMKINENTEYFIQKWQEKCAHDQHKDGDGDGDGQASASLTPLSERDREMDNDGGMAGAGRAVMQRPVFARQVSSASEMGEIQAKKITPFYKQIPILFQRQFRIFIRDKSSTTIRLGQILFIGVLMSIIWFQIKSLKDVNSKDPNAIPINEHNRFGAIFLATTFSAMNAVTTAIIVFPMQRLVFEKERAGGWYNSLPWLLAKISIDIPWTFVVMMPFAVILKYAVNLHADLFEFYFTLVLVALSADSIGFLLGCVANNQQVASQLMPVTIIPLMLFSNFFVSIDSIVFWLRWIQWLDCFYYGVEIMSILEFHDVEIDGEPVGNLYLKQFGMHPDNKWRDIYALVALFFGFRILSIFWILWKNGL